MITEYIYQHAITKVGMHASSYMRTQSQIMSSQYMSLQLRWLLKCLGRGSNLNVWPLILFSLELTVKLPELGSKYYTL